MADPAQTQTSSTFPNPPDFLWRQFTPDNVARFEGLKRQWQNQDPTAASSKHIVLVPDLSEDLKHLQPPPEPEDGTWRTHGGTYQLNEELPNLEEAGITRLQPNGNSNSSALPADSNYERALNLKRLAKSAMLNFLELVGVASINPEGIAEKADDIETILINMHSGINEYRPHQARESLIQTMQDRLDQIRAETAAVNAVTDKAKRVLEGLGSISAPGTEQEKLQGKQEMSELNSAVDILKIAEDREDPWAEAATFAI